MRISAAADAWILGAVEGYRVQFVSTPVRRIPLHPIRFAEADMLVVDDLMVELQGKQAIRPLEPARVRFLSNLFLVAKKGSDKRRPVINLKCLNEFIPDRKFKMEGWMEIKEAIFAGCYFARVDLKDAYLSVPVHEASQPFLAFEWRRKTFCWTRLPFGLKTSPRVFTKLLKPVVAALRHEGIVLIVYLDDFLLIADSARWLGQHARRACEMLESLGYTINFEKSSLAAARFWGTISIRSQCESRSQVMRCSKSKVVSGTCSGPRRSL